MLVLAGATLGAGAQSIRTDINPALVYGRAFLAAPNLAQADSDYLFSNNWQGQKFPERFGDLVATYDAEIQLVGAAAKSKVPCDWGVDMSPGPMTLLPHLARAKAVATVTRLRVMWHLQNQRQSEACDEMLAAFVLARNASLDGTLISTLVQMAMENILCSTIAANFGQFSPESLKRLTEAMNAAPIRHSVAECMPTEKAFFFDWALRKIPEFQKQNPGNDALVMEAIHQSLIVESPEEGDTNYWPRVAQAAGGTSDGVLQLLRDGGKFYERAVAFLNLPYPEFKSREKAFIKEMEEAANPFVAKAYPGFIKSRQKEFRTLAALTMVRAALEYKSRGDAGFKSVEDPCGKGPFAFQRFVFAGVDRGFQLKSAFNLGDNLAVLIFVEKEGPPFQVDGNFPGRALPASAPR